MRCPKCQYISFDSGSRCRNCGYEFSLRVEDGTVIEVPIHRDTPPPGRAHHDALKALDSPLSRGGAAAAAGEPEVPLRAPRPLPTAEDLPLFTRRVADDQAPLVTPPAVPRAPLSVRRPQPGRRGRLGLDEGKELPLESADADRDERAGASPPGSDAAWADAASVLRRAVAGLIDAAILLAVCASVVLLTLRFSELSPEQWQILPLPPLVSFLLLLCGGYLVLFTAACGQTIGKMAAGIRVVALTGDPSQYARVSFGAALTRALACLGSLAALGAGFLPVLLRPDRRAFHDRVAETRVVTA